MGNYRKPSKFNPYPFAYHRELELEIGSLTNGGHGVGRLDGWVVMVAFALPGERVRARLFRNHRNYSEADLVEVIEASPQRVEPRCPLFGACGGCQYQNLAYEAQLEWKRRQVTELLDHMVGTKHPVESAAASPNPYGYRTKLTPHYDRPKDGEIGDIGFLRHGQRQRLVDVPQCPIATPGINRELPGIRQQAREQGRGRRKGATLLVRESECGVTTDPHAVVRERVGELQLQFEAGTFFQNNPFLLPQLVEHVRSEVCATGVRHLVDAYCGCGLFALACAGSLQETTGVELSEASVGWARRNAESNAIDNVRFLAADAAAVFQGVDYPAEATAVIIDPPRRGCDQMFTDQLLDFKPRRIVYVSCNPATQMRDLRLLLDAGYTMRRIRPFDMFPQTKHLECVATLEQ